MHIVPANQTTFAFRTGCRAGLARASGRGRPLRDVAGAGRAPLRRRTAAGPTWLMCAPSMLLPGRSSSKASCPATRSRSRLLAIEPRDWGWSAAIPGFGLLDGLLPEPMLERLPIRDGEVIVSERVRLPVRPMIGCLGLAPAEGETFDSLAGDAVGRQLRSHPDRSRRDRALPGASPRWALLAGRSSRGDG